MLFMVLNTIDFGEWRSINLFLDNLGPGSLCFFQEEGGILQEDDLDGGLNALTCACFGCSSFFPQLINQRIFIRSLVAVFCLRGFDKHFSASMSSLQAS